MVYLNLDEISPLSLAIQKNRSQLMFIISFKVTVYIVCLISVGHTNSQLPTLYFNYKLKLPTVVLNVKPIRVGFPVCTLEWKFKARQVLWN